MIGETIYADYPKIAEVLDERIVTRYVQETEEQERARIISGLPPPSFQYTSVRTKFLRVEKSE